MSNKGNDVLGSFFKKLESLSTDERKKISSLVEKQGGTFVGAAWSVFRKSRYSPHREKQDKSTKSTSKSTATATKSTSKMSSRKSTKSPGKKPEKKPYIKELKPGIRTILFRTEHA
jgi:hypothetical protein